MIVFLRKHSNRLLGAGTLFLVVLSIGFILITKAPNTQKNDSDRYTTEYTSHFYKLKINVFKLPPTNKAGLYTSLYTSTALLGDQVIWVDGRGHFYLINNQLEVVPTKITLDMNEKDFDSAASEIININRFSVKDIAVRKGEISELFASYHYWHSDDACYTLRVAKANISSPIDKDFSPKWHVIYETEPCLPLAEVAYANQLMESGGRISFLNQNKLILTTGDNMYTSLPILNGGNTQKRPMSMYAQTSNSYGKTIIIDLDTGDSSIYSKGHRNPQGLFVEKSGTIYLTEHGPKGGDELNIVTKGSNFGWPKETLGTNYNSFDWPLADSVGEHSKFSPPFFSWVPSVGISDLEIVTSKLFPLWQGDLLAGSLTGMTLFRIRIRDQKIQYVEPIKLPYPIREIIELPDGKLLLSSTNRFIVVIEPIPSGELSKEKVETQKLLNFDETSLLTIQSRVKEADRYNGKLLYQQCSGCHGDGKDGEHSIGPSLHGILGKEIGAATGFVYSNELSKSNLVWDEALLDSWLKDPYQLFPRTNMTYSGLPDSKSRADLIKYIYDLGK